MKADSYARPSVFISYGRRDASKLAGRLRADLERCGHRVWLDTSQICAGRGWQDQVTSGIRSSDVVLALLSPHAVRVTREGAGDDSVCLDELSLARFGSPARPIIPVMALPCEPPFCVFRLDYIDLTASDDEQAYARGFERLVTALADARNGKLAYRRWDAWLTPYDFDDYIETKTRRFVGRDWLFEAVHQWSQKSDERALLITGDPGVGKSAFLAEFARSNRDSSVLAHYFCQASTSETLRPSRFIQTIAAMMAARIPELEHLIESAESRRALEQLAFKDPHSALEIGLLRHLRHVPPPPAPRYVLVDALDEAVAPPGTRSTIPDLLEWSRLETLPSWLRVIATSRRDKRVIKRLAGLRAVHIDAGGDSNRDDLKVFVSARMNQAAFQDATSSAPLSASAAGARLLETADGNFLYADLWLSAVERNQQNVADLVSLPPTVHGIFERDMNRAFAGQAKLKRSAKHVLALLVASGAPIPLDVLAATDLHASEAVDLLTPFLREQYQCFTLFHQSFFDWLLVVGHDWSIRRGPALQRLADQGLKVLADAAGQPVSSFWSSTLELTLAKAGQWQTLDSIFADASKFASLYPVSYNYSHNWDTLRRPFPHLLSVRELASEDTRAPLLQSVATAFALRARNILETCRPLILEWSVEGLDAPSFERARDGLYTFVYMAAQAIQAQLLDAPDAHTAEARLRSQFGDVIAFLSDVAHQQPMGLSAKLSDQAGYALDAL